MERYPKQSFAIPPRGEILGSSVAGINKLSPSQIKASFYWPLKKKLNETYLSDLPAEHEFKCSKHKTSLTWKEKRRPVKIMTW